MYSRASSALLVALLAGACARAAPALPPNLSDRPAEQRLLPGDVNSAEATLDCAGLASERTRNLNATAQLEGAIAGNRERNQAVVYLGGVLFPPLLLALKPDSDAKTTLDALQVQRDRIDRLSKAHKC